MEKLYLSKIAPDPALLHDAYRMHQALWELFPDRPEAQRSYLYRLEPPRAHRPPVLLLQSTERPDASASPSLRVLAGPKPFLPGCARGRRLLFRLAANPVKRLNATRNRVPLIEEAQRIAWLQRKLSPAVDIERVVIAGARTVSFRKGRQIGTIAVVEFEGLLRVTDPEVLEVFVRKGVGAAKAFGCGLLSLAPA